MFEATISISLLVVLVLLQCRNLGAQQLQVGFYKNTCNVVESIIREEVIRAFLQDKGNAAGLVRLHFHDCFVRGCDASILIDSTPGNIAEKDGPPNGITLRGQQVIYNAKARLEKQCKGIVSCADILAFAARDSVVITKGIGWDVPAGRRDGRISRAAETTDIPAPFFDLSQSTQAFVKKGLTQEEMVILEGAHTIGRSHCTSFSNRLYNFSPTLRQDPSLNPLFAAILKLQCPSRDQQGTVDPNLVVQMNTSPDIMDNSYYKDVLMHNVDFTSDQALTSPETLAIVEEYAANNTDWLLDFADAMVKMSKIEVLTAPNGEIRANCTVINP